MKLVRVKKIARRSMKWLNWLLLIPLCVLTLLSTLLLYTPTGLRFSSTVAEYMVPGLEIGSTEGSILGGHSIQNVSYQQKDLSLAIKTWQLRFNNSCLLSMQVCIDVLIADDIRVNIVTADSRASKSDSALPPLLMPIPLSINALTLSSIAVDINGDQFNVSMFKTSATAWGNKLQLKQPEMNMVKMHFAAATDNVSAANSTLQYQSPSLQDFSLPLGIFIDQFQLSDLEIINADSTQHVSALQLSMQWQQHQLNITEFNLDADNFSVQAAANINSQGNYAISSDARLTWHSTPLANQTVALQLDGDLANLSIQAQSQGPIQSDLSTKLNLLDSTLPHKVTLRVITADLAALSAAANIKLHDSELELSGSLNQSTLTSSVNLTGDSALQANATLAGKVNLRSAALDKLSIATLDGTITSTATLDWQDGLRWQSSSYLQHLDTGKLMPEYPGRLSGELEHSGILNSDGSWQVDVSQLKLDGDIRSHHLQAYGSVTATYLSNDGNISFNSPDLVFQHAANRLQLRGSVDHNWQLAAHVDAPSLQQSFAGIKGALSGDFSVTGITLQPQLKGTLQAKALSWQDLYLTSAQLDSLLWLDDKQKINTELTVHTTEGRYQTTRIDRVELSLKGNEQNHNLNVSAQAKDNQLALQLNGTLNEQRSSWVGTLEDAVISSAIGPWQLAAPMQLSLQLQPQQLKITNHCWRQRQSSLCVNQPVILTGDKAEISLELTDFDLATLNGLLPADTSVQGKINLQGQLAMQQGSLPSLQLNVDAGSGSLTQQLQTALVFSWQNIKLASQLQDDVLTNSLQLRLTDTASFAATVAVSQIQQGDKQLSGDIRLQQMAIDFLQPLLGEFSQFQGMLASNIALNGTLSAPLLSGDIRLSETKIKGKQAPTDIENADINVSFSGKQASLAGTITTPNGELTLSGNGAWPTLDDWQATIKLTGDALKLQVPNARLQVAPELNIQLTPELARLNGTVTIPVADINIDSLPQNAVELSDDLVLLDTHLQPIPQQDKTALNMQTDIKVVLGERVKLSAFGLKTHLKGNLRVRQQPKQPLRLNGDVNLVDGTFRAYGQDLLIRKGKMSFNGPADQPFLSIEAIRNPDNMEDDVIAGIRVDGPADSPSVVVFSEPSKAQASALSYLIMGRDLDSSSGTGGNALTTGLIGMTLASSSKVIGEIGEAFGLRELTLDTAGAGDKSQVTVSGYLSRDLQLKYGYGIFNAVGEFTLRYRIMRRLYLEAVSGVDNAVDLLYKFEFD